MINRNKITKFLIAKSFKDGVLNSIPIFVMSLVGTSTGSSLGIDLIIDQSVALTDRGTHPYLAIPVCRIDNLTGNLLNICHFPHRVAPQELISVGARIGTRQSLLILALMVPSLEFNQDELNKAGLQLISISPHIQILNSVNSKPYTQIALDIINFIKNNIKAGSELITPVDSESPRIMGPQPITGAPGLEVQEHLPVSSFKKQNQKIDKLVPFISIPRSHHIARPVKEFLTLPLIKTLLAQTKPEQLFDRLGGRILMARQYYTPEISLEGIEFGLLFDPNLENHDISLRAKLKRWSTDLYNSKPKVLKFIISALKDVQLDLALYNLPSFWSNILRIFAGALILHHPSHGNKELVSMYNSVLDSLHHTIENAELSCVAFFTGALLLKERTQINERLLNLYHDRLNYSLQYEVQRIPAHYMASFLGSEILSKLMQATDKCEQFIEECIQEFQRDPTVPNFETCVQEMQQFRKYIPHRGGKKNRARKQAFWDAWKS